MNVRYGMSTAWRRPNEVEVVGDWELLSGSLIGDDLRQIKDIATLSNEKRWSRFGIDKELDWCRPDSERSLKCGFAVCACK